MRRFDLSLPHTAYPIFIGEHTLQNAEVLSMLEGLCPNGRAAVISDKNVWGLHGDQLNGLGIEMLPVVLPPGEGSKSLGSLQHVYAELCRFGLHRNDPIIAFGGGVIGDLAGFAASTFMRGLPFIQIPTTLLAQVDSSVGGKVAVNLEQGKNLVGSFYQPKMVVIDIDMLNTLPPREFAAGMAEVIKYAAIGERKLLSLLEGGREYDMAEVIELCCRSKAGFVERDEYDRGDRMMLNFGHTFGHAIEKLHHYETYNHGEAIAIGMMLAAKAGVLLGETSSDTPERLEKLLSHAGLDGGLHDTVSDIVPLMSGDKKNSGSLLTLVLVKGMGQPFIYHIAPAELKRVMEGSGLWEK